MGHKCGSGARACEVWELWTTAILNSLSNFLVLPAIRIAHRQGLRFETMFAIFGLISSSLYHFCEPLGIRVLNMNDGQWHRLDNVAAIMCFVNLFVYLSDFREEWHGEYLKYFMLGLTLILQESGPWELKNTLVPILIAACFPFLRYILARKKPDYDWRNFYLGWGLMGVAFVFFVNGLDDEHDYLRCYHTGWHVMVSASSYSLWQIVLSHRYKLHLT